MTGRYLTLLTILFLASSARAQRLTSDYSIALDRNAWLASNNGAALTTFRDTLSAELSDPKSVTKAGLYYSPLTVDVASVYRLSSKTVVSGRIAFSYDSDDNHTGSAFHSQESSLLDALMQSGAADDAVRPFDIIITTPGKLKAEEIFVAGAIGWQFSPRLSLGAKAAYTVANTARQKDLRYSNFRMDLATHAGVFYSTDPAGKGGIGLSLYYRRATESLTFSCAGTTDIIHTSLIDYANGLGIYETFSGDGFTDDTEQPLFSEYKGLSAQINLPIASRFSLFADMLYAHRSGYYGKLSQYTIRHTEHRSDCYRLHSRLTFNAANTLHLIDASLNIENLVNHRTNYLSQTVDGVTSYTYFATTKTANKVQAAGHIAYIAHIPVSRKSAENGAYWRLSLGTLLNYQKQTAWLFPECLNISKTKWRPYITLQRAIPLKGKFLLTPQLAISTDNVCGGVSINL